MVAALAIDQLFKQLTLRLGAQLTGRIDQRGLCNQVGQHLYSMRAWRHLERAEGKGSIRAAIDVAGASWVDATLTLTSAGAFTNYTFLEGDEIEVKAGTNTTLGFHRVASRVDANSITLVTSLGATASAIDGRMPNDSVALPPNFASLLDPEGVTMRDRSSWPVKCEIGQLLSYRALQSPPGNASLYYAVQTVEARDANSGSPTMRLAIYPEQTQNRQDALAIVYRADWKALASDQTHVFLPPWLFLLFEELCCAAIQGKYESDVAGVAERFDAVAASSLYAAAVSRDMQMQTHVGALRGGAVKPSREGYRYGSLRSQVTPPS